MLIISLSLGHKFSDLPNGFAGLAAVPAFGLVQIILSIGWWELKGWKQVNYYLNSLYCTLFCLFGFFVICSFCNNCCELRLLLFYARVLSLWLSLAIGSWLDPWGFRHQIPRLHQDWCAKRFVFCPIWYLLIPSLHRIACYTTYSVNTKCIILHCVYYCYSYCNCVLCQ